MHATPIWQAYRPLMQLPSSAKSWLLDEGSLTARLIKESQGRFAVQRLRQEWQVPALNERQALGLHTREMALVREVFLLCHDQPWVYARSVLPQRSLTGSLRVLRRLKNRSLGSFLFKNPHLQRDAFEICQLDKASAYIPMPLEQAIYGRRSVFTLEKKPLLVSEFFLPACSMYQHKA